MNEIHATNDTTHAEPRTQRFSLLGRWIHVFRTGNPPPVENLDRVTRWLVLTRAAVQPMTLTSAVLAGLVALRANGFRWQYYLLSVLGLVLAHAANNLMNDFFDVEAGSDTDNYPRALYAPHPVLSGIISRRGLGTAAAVLNLIDLGILVLLFRARGWPIVAFAIAGLFLSIAYTAPPLRLKKIGLGEAAVFVVWGPLMVGGTYYAAVGTIGSKVWAFSIPYGLLASAVLMGKHIDKIPWDRELGIKTLPVILGEERSKALTRVLMWGFYPAVAALVLLRVYPWPAIICFLGIHTLLKVDKVIRAPKPNKKPERFTVWPLWYAAWTFLHTRRAGALLVVGVALGTLLFPVHLT
ncbi:MAG: prenyltransferase [Acidimicrobiia bacterium]